MKLYHFTHATSAPEVTLDPSRIGENPWTQGDYKEAKTPRTYFYTEHAVPEHWVAKGHRYAADVDDKHVYDLENNHLNLSGHADRVLEKLKSLGYKGAKFYGGQIVAMMEPVHATSA